MRYRRWYACLDATSNTVITKILCSNTRCERKSVTMLSNLLSFFACGLKNSCRIRLKVFAIICQFTKDEMLLWFQALDGILFITRNSLALFQLQWLFQFECTLFGIYVILNFCIQYEPKNDFTQKVRRANSYTSLNWWTVAEWAWKKVSNINRCSLVFLKLCLSDLIGRITSAIRKNRLGRIRMCSHPISPSLIPNRFIWVMC